MSKKPRRPGVEGEQVPQPPKGALKLRRWRKRKGLTQSEAAEILGIDLVKLSRYERGVHRPRLERALEFERRTDGAVPVSSWENPELKAS